MTMPRKLGAKRSVTPKAGLALPPDGTSRRANRQLRDYNRAFGWIRFLARILLTGIPGRREATQVEDNYIDAYRQKHGQKPPGNE